MKVPRGALTQNKGSHTTDMNENADMKTMEPSFGVDDG